MNQHNCPSCNEVFWCNHVKEQGDPVAWRSQDPDGYWSIYQSAVEGAEPLYTGFKELTDEKIMEIFKAYEQMQEYGYLGKKPFQVHLGWTLEDRNSCLMLARAILRMASE